MRVYIPRIGLHDVDAFVELISSRIAGTREGEGKNAYLGPISPRALRYAWCLSSYFSSGRIWDLGSSV